MRFYTQQHQHYCGVDLHARTMYLCIMDQASEILLHRNMVANPEEFLAAFRGEDCRPTRLELRG